MRSPQEAFRAYYASMTDADLLAVAANKGSFLDVAQRVLGEEMARRHLSPPAPTAEAHAGAHSGGIGRFLHLAGRR